MDSEPRGACRRDQLKIMNQSMIRSHKKTINEILGRPPIHPFPARMAPGIALDALGVAQRPLRVLDPMAGSGTVLAVARSKGHQAFGIDMDPLAVLLSQVWTRTIDASLANSKANDVLNRARWEFANTRLRDAYPTQIDDETRAFIRYWFDSYARRQLAALSRAISRVRNRVIRDVLWCGFSRLIITKRSGASLAMDLSHSRPHRVFKYAPIKPFNKFLSAVKLVTSSCPQTGCSELGPRCMVELGDARALTLEDESIDLVLTSPPYLNAIDYLRCSKFSLVWMGYTVSKLRKIRSRIVGAEASSQEASKDKHVSEVIKLLRLRPRLSGRDHVILSRYVFDMQMALKEAARVLRKRGRAVYVVGDSTVRGTFVRNSEIVATVAESSGLELVSRHTRKLPENRRYLPPPSGLTAENTLNSRMRREVVLEFKKPAA